MRVGGEVGVVVSITYRYSGHFSDRLEQNFETSSVSLVWLTECTLAFMV